MREKGPIPSILFIKMVAHVTHINHCLVLLATVCDESQAAALSDPPLEHNTSNDAGCNHISQMFYFNLHTKSAAMAAIAAQVRNAKVGARTADYFRQFE